MELAFGRYRSRNCSKSLNFYLLWPANGISAARPRSVACNPANVVGWRKTAGNADVRRLAGEPRFPISRLHRGRRACARLGPAHRWRYQGNAPGGTCPQARLCRPASPCGDSPTALAMVETLTRPFRARHPEVQFTILSRTSIEIFSRIWKISRSTPGSRTSTMNRSVASLRCLSIGNAIVCSLLPMPLLAIVKA